MNIFVLDTDVVKCAQYHLDKHCVKMILETTQLLNNALIFHNKFYVPIYRETHKNHPASIWARTSRDNFDWLSRLGLELCKEYTYRYGRRHRCHGMLEDLAYGKAFVPAGAMTPFAKCMPDQYKVDDAVQSYRNYYHGDKAYIARWKGRTKPDWWVL